MFALLSKDQRLHSSRLEQQVATSLPDLHFSISNDRLTLKRPSTRHLTNQLDPLFSLLIITPQSADLTSHSQVQFGCQIIIDLKKEAKEEKEAAVTSYHLNPHIGSPCSSLIHHPHPHPSSNLHLLHFNSPLLMPLLPFFLSMPAPFSFLLIRFTIYDHHSPFLIKTISSSGFFTFSLYHLIRGDKFDS
jgi:hypothetical protein